MKKPKQAIYITAGIVIVLSIGNIINLFYVNDIIRLIILLTNLLVISLIAVFMLYLPRILPYIYLRHIINLEKIKDKTKTAHYKENNKDILEANTLDENDISDLIQSIITPLKSILNRIEKENSQNNQLNSKIVSLNQEIDSLENTLGSTFSAIEVIKYSIRKIHSNVEFLDSSLLEVSTSISEANSSLSNIKTNIDAQSISASKTHEMTCEAVKIMETDIQEIESINTINASLYQITIDANNKIKILIDTSKKMNSSILQIDSILKNIDDIADKTKVLSINASIEAARAGIHGKGFTILSSEVRNLAILTADSTKTIQNVMKSITDLINILNGNITDFSETFNTILCKHIELSSSVGLLNNAGKYQNDFNKTLLDFSTKLNTTSSNIVSAVYQQLANNKCIEEVVNKISDESSKIHYSLNDLNNNMSSVNQQFEISENILTSLNNEIRELYTYQPNIFNNRNDNKISI